MNLLLLLLKILLFLIDVFFIVYLIIFLRTTRWFKFAFVFPIKEFFTKKLYGSKKAKEEYRKNKKRIASYNEKDYKRAIVRMDKALDDISKGLVPSFQANNLEERLFKLTSTALSGINELQDAHEICLEIKQNSDYELDLEEGKIILETYHQALKELEII